MTGTDSLADWLGARSDAELVSLLELRPDLAVPLPSSMTVLAARAEQRASVLRAADELDTLEFAIIETLAVRAASAQPPLTRRELKKLLRDRVKAAPVDAALRRLTERALIWSDGDALRVVPAAAEALPWPMGSTTELPDALTEPEVTAALAEISPPNGLCWTSWPPPVRAGAPRTPPPAPRPIVRCSSC